MEDVLKKYRMKNIVVWQQQATVLLDQLSTPSTQIPHPTSFGDDGI